MKVLSRTADVRNFPFVFVVFLLPFVASSCVTGRRDYQIESRVDFKDALFADPFGLHDSMGGENASCSSVELSNRDLISIVLNRLVLEYIDDRYRVSVKESGCDYLVGVIPQDSIGGGMIFRISRDGVIVRELITH